jgi:hypothetical protein
MLLLLAGCAEGEEPLDGAETPASTPVEPDATAGHTPEQPTPFPTRAPGPPAPAVMVDLDTFSEEWLERVTPVPETGVIILSSQEWRVTYYSVSGDSAELVETVERETGVEFAYPAYVPEGLALQHIVAERELLGPDDVGGYTGGIDLTWSDALESRFVWEQDERPPPQVSVMVHQGTFRLSLDGHDLDVHEEAARLEDGTTILRAGVARDGVWFLNFLVLAAEPGDVALYHAMALLHPGATVTEEDIIAMLASLPR